MTIATSLGKIPDIELISRVKQNSCSDSLEELGRRYSNIFYKFCQGYIKVLVSKGHNRHDIFDEKDYILYRAVMTYNPQKGATFCTWLANYTRYFCLNKINQKKHTNHTGTEEEIEQFFDAQIMETYENPVIGSCINGILGILSQQPDERITKIFSMRYGAEEKPWKAISEEMNLSLPAAMTLHKRGLTFLKNTISEQNLNILDLQELSA